MPVRIASTCSGGDTQKQGLPGFVLRRVSGLLLITRGLLIGCGLPWIGGACIIVPPRSPFLVTTFLRALYRFPHTSPGAVLHNELQLPPPMIGKSFPTYWFTDKMAQNPQWVLTLVLFLPMCLLVVSAVSLPHPYQVSR